VTVINLITINVGQEVSVSATVEDTLTEAPVDPSNISILVEQPDGTNVTYAVGDLTHAAAGLYTKLVTLDQRGTYGFRIVTDNPDSAYQFNMTTEWRTVT